MTRLYACHVKDLCITKPIQAQIIILTQGYKMNKSFWMDRQKDVKAVAESELKELKSKIQFWTVGYLAFIFLSLYIHFGFCVGVVVCLYFIHSACKWHNDIEYALNITNEQIDRITKSGP